MSCTRCRVKQHGFQVKKSPPAMDPVAARETLTRAVACLDAAGFAGRYFVVDGTLLGLVREGGFISRDYDIDFGMWAEDYDPKIIDAMVAAGFAFDGAKGKPDDGLLLKFASGPIPVDIAFYYRESGFAWAAGYKGQDLQMRYRYPVFGTEPASLCGVAVFVPSPPEHYLRAIYGPDWRLPVRNWEFRYGPHNVHAHGSPVFKLRFLFGRTVWRLRNRDNHIAQPGRVVENAK